MRPGMPIVFERHAGPASRRMDPAREEPDRLVQLLRGMELKREPTDIDQQDFAPKQIVSWFPNGHAVVDIRRHVVGMDLGVRTFGPDPGHRGELSQVSGAIRRGPSRSRRERRDLGRPRVGIALGDTRGLTSRRRGRLGRRRGGTISAPRRRCDGHRGRRIRRSRRDSTARRHRPAPPRAGTI